MILVWRYDLTREGVMEESAAEAVGEDSLFRGRRFDVIIIVVLALTIALLLAERLTLESRDGDTFALGVAVLPFDNLSTSPDDAYLAGGMHEEVLTRLTRVPELRVISRTTMERIDDAGLSVPEIGQRLGVSHVLEGSVRRDEDRVRVTVQLIDATDDRHLWAKNFDRSLTDLFAVQSEIALAIAAQLSIELSPETVATVAETATVDPRAYVLYLQVIDEFRSSRGGGDLQVVRGLLEQAIEIDPDFLQAKALLIDVLGRDGRYDPDGSDHARALRLLNEIQRSWPNHILARRALGAYYYTVENDYERALEEYRAVIAVAPSDIVAVVNLRNAYKRLERREEWLYWARRAVDLSPESRVVAGELRLALVANGLFDEAVEFTHASATRFPDDPSWEVDLVRQHLYLFGDVDAFLAAAETLRDSDLWSDLGTDLTWIYYQRDGMAMAEKHLAARRSDSYDMGTAFADDDYAQLLRLEGRAEEAQVAADRALAFVTSEFPVDQGGMRGFPIHNLELARIAAVAGDRETAEAYLALVDIEDYQWIFLRAMAECRIGHLEAQLGNPVSGWSLCEPYADDPYLWVTREFLRVSPYHRWLFGDAPAFQAFIGAQDTAGE
jgi:TolB-like protein